MQKTVKVVDEVGNRYEATYVKRAKGLVKNGRACFIDEDTICLVRPPNNTEDIKMTDINKKEALVENVNVEVADNSGKPLTAREIFEKIVELQEQLTKNSYHSLHRLSDAIASICESENEEKVDQVNQVCGVFTTRELTFKKMISLYENMYNDLKNK